MRADRIAIFGPRSDPAARHGGGPVRAAELDLLSPTSSASRTCFADGPNEMPRAPVLQRGERRWRIAPEQCRRSGPERRRPRRRSSSGPGEPARGRVVDAPLDGANGVGGAQAATRGPSYYLGPTRKIELALAGVAAAASRPERRATGGPATGSGSSGRGAPSSCPIRRRLAQADRMPRHVPEDSLQTPGSRDPRRSPGCPRVDARRRRPGDRRRPIRYGRHLPGRRSVRPQRGAGGVRDAPPVQHEPRRQPVRGARASTMATWPSCLATPSGSHERIESARWPRSSRPASSRS